MNKRFSRGVAVLTAAAFSTNVAMASINEANIWNDRRQHFREAPTPSAAFSPLLYGRIQKSSRPSTNNPAKTVLHIQDVHANLEAQQNIGKALSSLIADHCIQVVALEGAFGPLDLSGPRHFPSLEGRRIAADFALENGLISGPIHAALTASGNIPKFIGVDDQAHYDANVRAYQQAASEMPRVKTALDTQAHIIETAFNKLENQPLARFEAQVQAFNHGSVSLVAHLKLLESLSKSTPDSRQMKRFLEASQLEQQLDIPRVENGRTRLLNMLTARLNNTDSQNLIRQSLLYRTGQLAASDYYRALTQLCRQKKINIQQWPQFDAYVRYTLLADEIEPEQLFREIKVAEKEVFASLTRNDHERKLVASAQRLALEQKLVAFALTKEEWEAYKKGVPGSLFLVPSKDLEPFKEFYSQAEMRDEKIAQNLSRLIDSFPGTRNQELGTVVLVTGGFHSKGIHQALSKQDVAVASFIPHITKTDDGSNYLSVFAQAKSPLDKLFDGEKLFLSPPPFSPKAEVKMYAAEAFSAILLGLMLSGTAPQIPAKVLSANTTQATVIVTTPKGEVTEHLTANSNGQIKTAVTTEIKSQPSEKKEAVLNRPWKELPLLPGVAIVAQLTLGFPAPMSGLIVALFHGIPFVHQSLDQFLMRWVGASAISWVALLPFGQESLSLLLKTAESGGLAYGLHAAWNSVMKKAYWLSTEGITPATQLILRLKHAPPEEKLGRYFDLVQVVAHSRPDHSRVPAIKALISEIKNIPNGLFADAVSSIEDLIPRKNLDLPPTVLATLHNELVSLEALVDSFPPNVTPYARLLNMIVSRTDLKLLDTQASRYLLVAFSDEVHHLYRHVGHLMKKCAEQFRALGYLSEPEFRRLSMAHVFEATRRSFFLPIQGEYGNDSYKVLGQLKSKQYGGALVYQPKISIHYDTNDLTPDNEINYLGARIAFGPGRLVLEHATGNTTEIPLQLLYGERVDDEETTGLSVQTMVSDENLPNPIRGSIDYRYIHKKLYRYPSQRPFKTFDPINTTSEANPPYSLLGFNKTMTAAYYYFTDTGILVEIDMNPANLEFVRKNYADLVSEIGGIEEINKTVEELMVRSAILSHIRVKFNELTEYERTEFTINSESYREDNEFAEEIEKLLRRHQPQLPDNPDFDQLLEMIGAVFNTTHAIPSETAKAIQNTFLNRAEEPGVYAPSLNVIFNSDGMEWANAQATEYIELQLDEAMQERLRSFQEDDMTLISWLTSPPWANGLRRVEGYQWLTKSPQERMTEWLMTGFRIFTQDNRMFVIEHNPIGLGVMRLLSETFSMAFPIFESENDLREKGESFIPVYVLGGNRPKGRNVFAGSTNGGRTPAQILKSIPGLENLYEHQQVEQTLAVSPELTESEITPDTPLHLNQILKIILLGSLIFIPFAFMNGLEVESGFLPLFLIGAIAATGDNSSNMVVVNEIKHSSWLEPDEFAIYTFLKQPDHRRRVTLEYISKQLAINDLDKARGVAVRLWWMIKEQTINRDFKMSDGLQKIYDQLMLLSLDKIYRGTLEADITDMDIPSAEKLFLILIAEPKMSHTLNIEMVRRHFKLHPGLFPYQKIEKLKNEIDSQIPIGIPRAEPIKRALAALDTIQRQINPPPAPRPRPKTPKPPIISKPKLAPTPTVARQKPHVHNGAFKKALAWYLSQTPEGTVGRIQNIFEKLSLGDTVRVTITDKSEIFSIPWKEDYRSRLHTLLPKDTDLSIAEVTRDNGTNQTTIRIEPKGKLLPIGISRLFVLAVAVGLSSLVDGSGATSLVTLCVGAMLTKPSDQKALSDEEIWAAKVIQALKTGQRISRSNSQSTRTKFFQALLEGEGFDQNLNSMNNRLLFLQGQAPNKRLDPTLCWVALKAAATDALPHLDPEQGRQYIQFLSVGGLTNTPLLTHLQKQSDQKSTVNVVILDENIMTFATINSLLQNIEARQREVNKPETYKTIILTKESNINHSYIAKKIPGLEVYNFPVKGTVDIDKMDQYLRSKWVNLDSFAQVQLIASEKTPFQFDAKNSQLGWFKIASLCLIDRWMGAAVIENAAKFISTVDRIARIVARNA